MHVRKLEKQFHHHHHRGSFFRFRVRSCLRTGRHGRRRVAGRVNRSVRLKWLRDNSQAGGIYLANLSTWRAPSASFSFRATQPALRAAGALCPAGGSPWTRANSGHPFLRPTSDVSRRWAEEVNGSVTRARARALSGLGAARSRAKFSWRAYVPRTCRVRCLALSLSPSSAQTITCAHNWHSFALPTHRVCGQRAGGRLLWFGA